MIRCAIYDRVSTDMQVKEGLSLEAQKQALTDYALSHHYQIVGYYTDEGITARKKMQNRKNLLRLLEDVRADKIDLILVTKLDRWFRNIRDYHNTQAILEAHHCNWKTIFEQYDTTTSNGRFAINIMLSVNENECDRDSERIRSVFDYKKQNREYLSGRPAYGYLVDKKKQLVKDDSVKSIVEDIFTCYFATYSKRETIRHIRTKYREAAPSVCQIQRILSSETYTGRLYGIDGYCEAYISKEQFQKIKTVSDAKIIHYQNEPFLFSSLIRCPVCGKSLSGFVKRYRRKDGSINATKRYRCSNKYTSYHNGACLSEQTVESYLLQHIINNLPSAPFTLRVDREAPVPSPDTTAAIRTDTGLPHLSHRHDAYIDGELERLNKLYLKGRITEAFYEKSYLALQSRQASYAKDDTKDNTEAPKDCLTPQPLTFTGTCQELYAALDIPHRKAFWKNLLSAIYLDAESRQICGVAFLVQ